MDSHMPSDKHPNPEDTARIDLRELEASADEAGRHLLLLSIGALDLPSQADEPSSTRPSTVR